MKRVTALLLALLVVLGSTGAARADGIDVKVKGEWDFAFGWADKTVFPNSVHFNASDRDDDSFIARQRIRTQVNFITSEYLQGVLMFEIGDINWGRAEGNNGPGSGGALDSDGVNIETKLAYLDWLIPTTEVSVRMGIQSLVLPSTPLGTPVLDADVAGVVISSPVTDWLSVTALWARPFDQNYNDGNRHYNDEVDIFGLLLPVEGEGWKLTPWGLYGFLGANSGVYDLIFADEYDNTVDVENSHTKAWWVGAHLELTLLEPLVFNVEGIYGRMNRVDLGRNFFAGYGFDPAMEERVKASGWFVAATLDYELDWGTPGIFAWWSSGDDKNADQDGKIGRLLPLSVDNAGFAPTSFGSAGTYSIGTDSLVTASGLGSWGVGIQLADFSFVEDLTHTLRFAYYRGTNDAELVKKTGEVNFLKYRHDGLYLTDEDSVFEVNFDHSYQIYENLTAVVELGYLRLNADADTWSNKNNLAGRTNLSEHKNAWKAQLMFQYSF